MALAKYQRGSFFIGGNVDGFIGALLSAFTSGKSVAEFLPLMMGIIIWYLLGQIKKLEEENQKKDAKFEKIIDDYYNGNLTLTETLNSLKLVLYEIKGRITQGR